MAEVVNSLFKRRPTVPANDLQKLTESEAALAQSTFNIEKITEIQNKFARGEVLLVPGRIFIREGVLWKVCRKETKKRHFFLFNDILVYGSIISQGHYRNQHVLPLSSMSVSSECHYMPQVELEDDGEELSGGLVPENAFQINHANKSFHVYSHSKADKVHWIHHLNKQIGKINQGDSQVIHKAVWVPDSASKQCMLCDQKFSAFNRKHHCRMCGRVVCSTCSPDRVDIAELVGAGSSGKLERVCKQCNKPFKSIMKQNDDKSGSPDIIPINTLSVPSKDEGNESSVTEDSDDSDREEAPPPEPTPVVTAPTALPRKKKPPPRPEPYQPPEKRSQSTGNKPPRPPPPNIRPNVKLKSEDLTKKEDDVPSGETKDSTESNAGKGSAEVSTKSEEDVTVSQELHVPDTRPYDDYSSSSSSSSSSSLVGGSFMVPLPGMVKKPRAKVTNGLKDSDGGIAVESRDITEGSHDVTEESHNVTEESHGVTEESHDVTEESHDVTEESHDVTEESHDVTVELSENSHDITNDITEDSHDVTVESHDVTEKPQDTTEESRDVTEESRDVKSATDESHDIRPTPKVEPDISTTTDKTLSPVAAVRKRKSKIVSEEAGDSQTPPTEADAQSTTSLTDQPPAVNTPPMEIKSQMESPVTVRSPSTHARQRRSKFTTTNT